MNKLLETTGVALAALTVSACAGPSAPEAPTPKIGLANPASVYCAKIGGTLKIENAADGQRGICVLPDGTEIEEWELFRRVHPSK